jgi:predicted Zn-dependent protease
LREFAGPRYSRILDQMRFLKLHAVALSVALAACGGAQRQGAPPADPLALSSPDELFQDGLNAAERGDYVRAEQYLVASVDRGYSEAKAMPVLVKICLAASRYRSALQYALPYLERHPDQWALRYLVGTIYLGIGDSKSARQELTRVTYDAPEQGPPHYLLAVMERDQFEDPARARMHFERYLELDPNGERALEARAALREMQRDDAAGSDQPEAEPSLPTELPSPPEETSTEP